MATVGEVYQAFKDDGIAKIVSGFYDNVMEAKQPGRPNHFGTVSFCQFVKYAKIEKRKIKRGFDEKDLIETTISVMLDEDRLEIMETREIYSLILGTSGGYRMHLVINNQMVIDYEVDAYDRPVNIHTYIKGDWIGMLTNENNTYKLDINESNKFISRVDNVVDPNKFKL